MTTFCSAGGGVSTATCSWHPQRARRQAAVSISEEGFILVLLKVRSEDGHMALTVNVSQSLPGPASGQVVGVSDKWIAPGIACAGSSALCMSVSKDPVLLLSVGPHRTVGNVAHLGLRSVVEARSVVIILVVAGRSAAEEGTAAVKDTASCRVGADEEWVGVGVAQSVGGSESRPPERGRGNRSDRRLRKLGQQAIHAVSARSGLDLLVSGSITERRGSFTGCDRNGIDLAVFGIGLNLVLRQPPCTANTTCAAATSHYVVQRNAPVGGNQNS